MNEQILKASKCFVARQDRSEHPDGEFDGGGRWEPSKREHCDCCNAVRSPSRAWPYSLMVHCRTAKHIAHLYGVSERDIKREAKNLRAMAEAELVAA